MQTRISKLTTLTVAAVLLVSFSSRAQENPLEGARNQVVVDLVNSLPATLPDGGFAILPCGVADQEKVDGLVSTTWATAMAEAMHSSRPAVVLTDRDHLTQVLREQKFGDSAYADPSTAVEVGKLVAARLILLTTLHEFRLRSGRVRVNLEATLVDVETGRNLWSRAYTRGIFPFWSKVLLALVLAVLFLVGWRVWDKRRRITLVKEKLPREKAGVRVDVDGLARSVFEARERLQNAGEYDAAAEVQQAWVNLDSTLDRVRHALPGGEVDRSRSRDLKGALTEAERLGEILGRLRVDCDRSEASHAGGKVLVKRMVEADSAVRATVDAFQRLMV